MLNINELTDYQRTLLNKFHSLSDSQLEAYWHSISPENYRIDLRQLQELVDNASVSVTSGDLEEAFLESLKDIPFDSIGTANNDEIHDR